MVPTAVLLGQWEKGSVDAERLCADLLRLDDFQEIDPQHPRGGPDGGKDVLCSKDGNSFVAAAYFARDNVTFASITKKFAADLSASLKHECNGFIFLTNQELTADQRRQLEVIAAASGKRCLVYHRERLRVVLDSPSGYGLRLRHLGTAMTAEEQAAYFASSGQSFTKALAAQTRAIENLTLRVTKIGDDGIHLVRHTAAVIVDAVRARSPDRTDVAAMFVAYASGLDRSVIAQVGAVSANLTSALLCYIHRLIVPGEEVFGGRFRETQVWLVATSSEAQDIECPPWDKVPALVDEMLETWRVEFHDLIENPERAIGALAKFFHHLLWIHPFVDGNGRLATAILRLQAREIFGLDRDLLLDQGTERYEALRRADSGNFADLEDLIRRSVLGAR